MTQQKNISPKKVPGKEKAVQALGAVGYFTGVIQWLGVFALYFTWVVTYLIEPMQPRDRPSVQPVVQDPSGPASEPSLLLMFGLGLLVLIMVGVTIYAVAKLPQMVSRAGSKTVEAAVKQAAPLIIKAQHLPDTEKSRYVMSARLRVFLKVLIIALPVGLAFATHFIGDLQVVSVEIALLVSAILAAPTLFFFSLQYAVAALAKVPFGKVR